MKYQMNLAISLNQKYFRYTYVMLTSFFESNRDAVITVYVLHSDLTEKQLGEFQRLAEVYGGKVISLFVDRDRFCGQLPVSEAWTVEAYYRLMMTELLPEDVEKILYLDVDMIIIDSLRELYETDFEGKLFLVCAEGAAKRVETDPLICQKLFADRYMQGFQYFNSGMMLWNVREIRKKYNFAYYMQIAELFEYTFAAPDQDILNYCHWQEVKYVETSVYNMFSRIAHREGKSYEDVKKETRIVHYAGAKPWDASCIHIDIDRFWWDYAKKTPYYNQLCEEMVYQTINDSFVEHYAQELLDHTRQLQQSLDESLLLNQQLLAMLNQSN